MQTYTYFFLDQRAVVQAFEFDECRDDAEARARAGEMLRARPERQAVEVWTNQAQVAVLAAG